jgi:hypothetical protein
MMTVNPPEVTPMSLPKDYTKITFEPDLIRFDPKPNPNANLNTTVADTIQMIQRLGLRVRVRVRFKSYP